ncbi:MAG: xanthine dehydrogenase family protein subunit M [Phycisphaerales bacterium]
MNTFAVARAKDYDQAARLVGTGIDGRYSLPVLKAGGMDVLDHVKEGLMAPDVLIDVRRARSAGQSAPVSQDGKLIRIEAWATLADIAASPLIRDQAPVLAQAVEKAATPQVRNVATAAGNLLQRPRCWYYRNDQFNCLKKGGGTCFSVEGENRYHAIFGGGPCHIVHPSNLAPALVVCDAAVHLTGSTRASLPIDTLFHLPDKGVTSEHTLEPGEVVTHITLSPRPGSGFEAVKEKQSFDWPLALACASVDVQGGKIASSRVCAGAVAPIPWALPKVEAALKGLSATDADGITRAADLAGDGAKPMTDNAYKVRLLRVVVRRAIFRAVGIKVEALA